MCFHSQSVIGPPQQLRCKSSRPPNKSAHVCCTLYTPHDCSLDKIVIFLVHVAKYLCINCMCFECSLKACSIQKPTYRLWMLCESFVVNEAGSQLTLSPKQELETLWQQWERLCFSSPYGEGKTEDEEVAWQWPCDNDRATKRTAEQNGPHMGSCPSQRHRGRKIKHSRECSSRSPIWGHGHSKPSFELLPQWNWSLSKHQPPCIGWNEANGQCETGSCILLRMSLLSRPEQLASSAVVDESNGHSTIWQLQGASFGVSFGSGIGTSFVVVGQ